MRFMSTLWWVFTQNTWFCFFLASVRVLQRTSISTNIKVRCNTECYFVKFFVSISGTFWRSRLVYFFKCFCLCGWDWLFRWCWTILNLSHRSTRPDTEGLSFYHGFFGQWSRNLMITVIPFHFLQERLDFSCAMFGPDGGLVANAPHIPVHLGSMQETVQYQV